MAKWTFLSNHAHVLVCLVKDPDIRVRDISDLVGITERMVIKIIHDLEDYDIVKITREGRRNHYDFNLDVQLRHPLEEHTSVKHLVKTLLNKSK